MILSWILYVLGVVMTLLLREFTGYIYRLAKSKLVDLQQHRAELAERLHRVEAKIDGLISVDGHYRGADPPLGMDLPEK